MPTTAEAILASPVDPPDVATSESGPVVDGVPPTVQSDVWGHVPEGAARRLLMAALAAFGTVGYHATTTRQIATDAGMSPAALYIHYASKAEVLSAIAVAGHEAALETLQAGIAAAGPDADPLQRLRRGIGAYAEWHVRNGLVARVIQVELPSLDSETWSRVRALRRRTTDLVTELLSEGTRNHQFTTGDPGVTMRCIFAIALDAARPRGYTASYAPEQLGVEYAEQVLRLVGADVTAAPEVPNPREGDERTEDAELAAMADGELATAGTP